MSKPGFIKSNVGTIDQAVRIMLGFVLVILAGTGVVGPWGYIGVLLMMTGAFRFCPAYKLFGLTTCPHPAAAKER
jgi:hypothetical protein